MALNWRMREHASMNIQTTPAVTWRTHLSLALLALVYIFSVIDRQIIAILMEPIKTEFGATDTQMGLLSGLAFGLFYAALECGHRGLWLCRPVLAIAFVPHVGGHW